MPISVNPYSLQLQQLQRRQQLADAMIQQGTTPINSDEVVGGGPWARVRKVSPLEVAAKLAQAYAGSKVQDQNDAVYQQIAQAMMGAQQGAVANLANPGSTPSSPFPAAPSSPSSAPVGMPSGAPSSGNAPASPANVPRGTDDFAGALQAAQTASMYGVDPEVLKAALAARSPTPEQKNISAAFGNGPAAQTVLQRNVNPAVPMQPNAPAVRLNPQTGQYEVAFAAPNMEKGIQPVVQNGQITGVQPLPGAADVAATMAGAQKAGEVSQTPQWAPNASGQPTAIFASPPMMRAGGIGAIGRGPQDLQTTGGKASQEALGKAGSDFATQLADKSAAAVEGKRTLSEMTGLLQGFQPGSFAPVLEKMGAAAQALGVSPETVQSVTGMNPGDAQAFQKGTAALATEAAKQVSSRVTQMEFKTFLANNPNWMMTPGGIKRVMDFMNKGFDSQIAQQQEFAGWSKQHPAESWVTDFPAYWNQKQTAAINSGQTRSTPASLSKTETAKDLANSAGAPKPIASKADYDKLPSGTKFVGPDGITYRKP